MAPKPRDYRNRVREIREKAGIHKLIDLARLAGISVATLSRIEHNQHGLSFTTARTLAVVLGCTMEDLIAKGGDKAGVDTGDSALESSGPPAEAPV